MTTELRLLDMPGPRQATVVTFTSPMGGIGRTSVVANLAWILASAGKRVLILDWGTEAPHVHEYLRPFHAETPSADELLENELLRMLAPLSTSEFSGATPMQTSASLVAREYRLPLEGCRINVVGPTGPRARFMPQQAGSGENVRLREQISSAKYDYILIDSPTDVSSAALERAALLSDVVAMCFNPRHNATLKAAELARKICDLAPVRMRILAVALQFDDQDQHRAQQTRSRIRDAFADLLNNSGRQEEQELSDDFIAIPYQPYDALFDEALTVLLDEPEQEQSSLSSYEELASAITLEDVNRLQPVPPHIRAKYRYALGLESLDAQAHTFLIYAPEDRLWADWVRHQLEQAGAQVTRLPQHDEWLNESSRPSVIVLASPHLSRSQAGERATEIAALRAQPGSGSADQFELVVIQLSDQPLAEPLASADKISFLHCEEAQARTRLLYHFVLIDRSGTGRRFPSVHFPAESGSASKSALPPRNPSFVGRGAELEEMRDYFLATDGVCVWTLSGAAGMGKSEIAKEYAHRFTFDYHLQWWISAENRRSVRDGLTKLADELRLPPGVDRPQEVLNTLASGHIYTKWLLLYDNVGEIETLRGLLPTGGTGHIIISTRRIAASTHEISAFQSNDSITLLRDQVPDLSVADAKRVAELVEHLPLGIRLAAAWMRESAALMQRQVQTRAGAAEWAATEFCARMDRHLSGRPTNTPASLAAALAVVAETLRKNDTGRLVLQLAQLCVFLSADGIALRLLRSAPMLKALASVVADDNALILDPLELDQVLRSGSLSGLIDVMWERPASLKMHRVLQKFVLDNMTPEERQERQREVLHGLAAFAPTDPEGECHQDLLDFVELQKHLEPSGAADSSEIAVRRWVVDQVGYLHRKGDPEAWQFAIELSERTLKGWRPGSRAETSLRMRLQFHLTNLHRELGHNTLLVQDQNLLEEQRKILGPTHPRTLKTGRSKGADLRSLGKFIEACGEERITLQGFREVLGEDHPDTLRAANNLALSFFLAGDVPSALALEKQNRDHRLALFGPDHSDVWWSTCNVGTYLRELGKYEEALKEFNDSLAHIANLEPPGHPNELRVRWNRAITLRRSGDIMAALEQNSATLREYRVLFGENHPRTRACQLSLALDHHQSGDSATAIELAEACLQFYVQTSPNHPFMALCQLNLAVFLRSLGQNERAIELSGVSHNDLHNKLGDEHPWVLTAALNHAHAVARVQKVNSAIELLRSTHSGCLEFLGRDHPYTRLAAKNLASEDTDQWSDVGVDLPET